MFPAMKMQQAELMQRYPSPQMLRQMIADECAAAERPDGAGDLSDQIAFYKMQQAKKQADDAAKAATAKADRRRLRWTDAWMRWRRLIWPAAMRDGWRLRGRRSEGWQEGRSAGRWRTANAEEGEGSNNDSMAMEAGKVALPGDGVDPSTPAMDDA